VVVMHVIVGLNVGGAELMLMRLVTSKEHKTDNRYVVVSLTDLGPVAEQLLEHGIEVYALDMRRLFDVPMVFLRLKKLIKKLKPDIVQTWMYHADFIGGLAAYAAGVKRIIWGIRSTDISKSTAKATLWIRSFCAKLSYKIPSVIVCAAEKSRQVHVEIGYDATRMQVIPNGFDLTRLTASAEEVDHFRMTYGLTREHVVIGCVGRFNPAKGFDIFISAAKQLRHFNSVVFLMVGRDLSSDNAQLMTWIDSTGCAERFILLGQRQDIPVCLAAMDIFCLSSRTEGFPNVVGEAMAMGCPCVVTDVGDAAVLVAETGVVVPSEDPTALAGALAQMIVLPKSERLQVGRDAQTRLYNNFSMAKCVERYDDLYNSLISR
jgi:glycosyltransferase involved in cell wall biosynthesis